MRFQSTPSAWRVTRPPSSGKRRDKFQSTPSAWRVTRATYLLPETSPQFQSTPSAWRVTSGGSRLGRNQQISIHTLRMEGDNFINNIIAHIKGFQSTPSAWRVTKVGQWVAQTKGFQSTPSAWRVTSSNCLLTGLPGSFQSTPSAWRVTVAVIAGHLGHLISIHTLRMEGDDICMVCPMTTAKFQSTPSAWRVT